MNIDQSVIEARRLLKQFKGENYVFGVDCYDQLPEMVRSLGSSVAVICGNVGESWADSIWRRTQALLGETAVEIVGERIAGARPNAPRDDVRRIASSIKERSPEIILAIGGGSGIDAAKCAMALYTLGDKHPDIEAYFGVGRVTSFLEDAGQSLPSLIAVQLAASSGAHLTKYSNITDLSTHQKKLIVDEALVPDKALFDYSLTTTMPEALTLDGALDGVAHAVEVLYGTSGEAMAQVAPVARTGIELIINSIEAACDDPKDLDVREKLGLGTDLGGYAIMLGGTSGAHLTSFSLVEILSHGRACALMNPYYTVFFAPAIQPQLRMVGEVFAQAGFAEPGIVRMQGRELGVAVAEAMIELSHRIGFPTTLREVDGFKEEHIRRALEAAKSPQLEMKLKNMPVPLSADTVDEYMGSVLEAARIGDFKLVKNMP